MSSSASSFQSSRPNEIERSDEILADLNGLTMDKKDMISDKYKYRFEQYQDWEILRKQVRCMDCFGKFLVSVYLHFTLEHETKHSS